MTDQTNKDLPPSVFLSNVHHAYAQTDGSYAFPNSREGDMLRTAKREIEQLRATLVSAPADIRRMRQQLEQEWCELQKLKASYASAPEEHVSYPKREDVTLTMRKSFERLYVDARRQDHSYLKRNEQGAYSNLRVDDDWIFYQRAWADALSASAPAAPMADMVPPATSRDRWMYEQGRLAERDPRTAGYAKAAYVRAFGSDDGWLGEPGSWFIEGYRAGGAPAAGSAPSDLTTDHIDRFEASLSDLGPATRQAAALVCEIAKRALLAKYSSPAIPDVLFDGHAVLQALEGKAKGRTSAENVSDVLDAVVRVLRARASAPQEGK